MIVIGGVAFIFIPGLCLGVWSTDLYLDCDWGGGGGPTNLYLDCDWGGVLQIYTWTVTGGGGGVLHRYTCTVTGGVAYRFILGL